MPDLIPILPHVIERQSKPGVSAHVLYAFLELNPSAYARWTKKNIVTNPYAIEHTDWEGLQHDVENRIDTASGGRPTQGYALSIDFAKRLAMMARSPKGEEARQYFLDCERQVLSVLPPSAKISQAQVSLAIAKALVDIEQRQDLIESRMDTIEARRPPVDRLDPIGWLRKYSKPRLERTLLKLFKAECRRLDTPVMLRPDHLDFPVPFYTEATLAAAYEASTRQIRFFEGTHDPGVSYQARRKGQR